MKKVVYIICVIALAYASSCQQKMICPAYHSYFILDVEETRNTFSLFASDSLPKKRWEVDKEKYGIAKAVSDKKKNEEMRIISMNSVYKKLEDPFDVLYRDRVAMGDTSIYIDSAAVIADSKGYNDFQNIDQMIYLHHFGKYMPKRAAEYDLLQQDLQVEQDEPLIQEEEVLEEEPKKKKKLWPFGKKNKKAKEEEEEAVEEEQ